MSVARDVAAVLGATRREGRGWRCRCPIHGGHSLVVTDGRDGLLLVRCWGGGCDPRAILAELRRLRLLDDVAGDRAAAAEVRSKEYDGDDVTRRLNIARRIWDGAEDARAAPLVLYLAGRGITISPPPALRWAPSLKRPDGTSGPAMVAVVEHVDRGITGVHRAWLTRDAAGIWRRRDRASLGPIGGGAVQLAPASETLMIGEGVETCLAAMQATALPAWAALSTSGMVALILPPVVRHVVILADNDRSGAGERAARSAAARWLREGDRRVRLALPPEPGTDFNDLLTGRAI
jgi:putative DNA primase/helicase